MIGQTINHYKITAKLGVGGMGEVYLAQDLNLGRKVALKFLSESLRQDSAARERLLREARAASLLSHPNILTVHAVEKDADHDFIAMEYIDGPALDDYCRLRNPSLAEIVSAAIQIADGLANAHQAGIVHRDLKPGNILMREDGRPVILDFGLAKLEGTERITQTGSTVGTMAYMSPELAQGLDVDSRSDLFSLGIILYEMLTGHLPFEAGHGAAILYAIVNENPAPLSDHREDIPVRLREITMKCLAKKPAGRYSSARELCDALREVQAEISGLHPVAPAPVGFTSILRRPVVAFSSIVFVLALTVLSIWMYQRSAKARWARQEALPEIERLLDTSPWYGGGHTWDAYKLGTEASRYIADDPLLSQLRNRYTSTITIHSDPAGATVFARPYGGNEDDWRELGVTPLDSVPFVRGVTEVRLELEGFEITRDLYWGGLFGGGERGYELLPSGHLPEGMVYISASGPDLHIDAAPAGIHMPGIEHLPPQDLGSFFVDRYEVTNAEYQRFVEAGGYEDPKYWTVPFDDDSGTLPFEAAVARFTDRTGQAGPATWEVGDYPDGMAQYPVTGISWFEANAYAAFAGKSLPSIYHWDRVALTWASGDIVPLSNLTGSGLVETGQTRGMNRSGAFDLAGNAREWCVNRSSRGGRFILGGGWNDPAYAFNDAYAQSPWDRSETNGLRCIKYTTTPEHLAEIEATIDLPFREFMKETPVSDETFALYLKQFDYDAAPLNATIEETREDEDFIRQKITFDAGYGGERMMAYLFLPKTGTPPYQTVVLFPGSGAIHTRSSEKLTLGSSAFLVKSGRAVLFPIYKSTYERGDGLISDYPDETNNWKEHVVMWGKDLRRSIDYLESREDTDAERVAYLGTSWGAAMGAIMMAIEPRLQTGLVVVAGMNFQRSLPEVDQFNYISHINISVLMLNGKYDFFFPYETSQLPFYELLGTQPEHKRLVLHEAGHAFPRTEQVRESLAWLDKYLGTVE